MMLERIIKRHSAKIATSLILAFMTLNVAWDWNTTNVGKKDKKQENKKDEGWFGCSKNEKGIKNLDTKEDISLKKVIEDYGTRSEIKYNLIAPINSWYGSAAEESRKFGFKKQVCMGKIITSIIRVYSNVQGQYPAQQHVGFR